MGRKNNSAGREGFTLIEAILVLAILAIVMLAFLVILRPQVMKAKDAQRKSDLSLIFKALEDYLNDHPCYPETSVLSVCGGIALRPYLSKVPCDPVTQQPYTYQNSECQKYSISAVLSTGESFVVSRP